MKEATEQKTAGTMEQTTAGTKAASTAMGSETASTDDRGRCCCDSYRVLVEFAVKHTDFQIPELQSVLGMNGIKLLPRTSSSSGRCTAICNGEDTCTSDEKGKSSNLFCRIVDLPNGLLGDGPDDAATEKKDDDGTGNDRRRRPFVVLEMPIHLAYRIGLIILQRCTLVRSVLELWGMGTSLASCVEATKLYWDNVRSRTDSDSGSCKQCNLFVNRQQKNMLGDDKSWKVTIHTLGSKYTRDEQEAMRSRFDFLDFPGPVRMRDPSNEFVVIHEVELDNSGGAVYPRAKKHKQQNARKKRKIQQQHAQPHEVNCGSDGSNGASSDEEISNADNDVVAIEELDRPPLACYFGRALNGTRKTKGRAQLDQYSLKRRPFLGPTSMDAELSFIMTNLGQVRKSSVVLDPFVGTGSILLSCALRGAYCVGTDIDIRILRGKGADANVLSNFRKFNLPRPELIRSDNAIYHRHFRTQEQGKAPLYDVIITDPPYGIRAGARKCGSRQSNPRPVDDDRRHDHIPQTRPYPVSDVMADLLDVAARSLILGGRLVYIIPSFSHFDPDADLPRHECLQIVHICYQALGAELGRRMVAMQKVKEYDPSKRGEYLAATWKNGPESADKCVNIRAKLLEAAKKKPGYEERAAIRKGKRRRHREAKKRAKRMAPAT